MTTTGGGAVDEGASPEERLAAMGLEAIRLPVFGAFVPAVRTGDLLHLMGHWPLRGGQPVTGRVGEDLSLDDGLEAARLAALAVVGTLVDELHDLARVRRIASVLMVVNATADFD